MDFGLLDSNHVSGEKLIRAWDTLVAWTLLQLILQNSLMLSLHHADVLKDGSAGGRESETGPT
jgi:hypothetical protein